MSAGWAWLLAGLVGVPLMVAVAVALDLGRRTSRVPADAAAGWSLAAARVVGGVYVLFTAVVAVVAVTAFAHGHVAAGLVMLLGVSFFIWRAVAFFVSGRGRPS
jgi:hypothetical protein